MMTEELIRPHHAHKIKQFKSLPLIKRISRKSFWQQVFKEVLVGFLVTLMAFLFSSLVFFKNQLALSANKSLEAFHWMVMVQGDQITIDEIGRYLNQFDHVERVDFLSKENLFDQIQKEGISREDLSLLNPTLLPSVWKIKWTKDADLAKLLSESLADVKNFPGVTDVVYSNEILKELKTNEWQANQLKLCLSGFLFLGLGMFLVLLGKTVFFSELSLSKRKGAWPFATAAFLFWSMGVGLFTLLVGPVSLSLFAAAAVIALLRSLYFLSDIHV